jgi:hypothetical protein
MSARITYNSINIDIEIGPRSIQPSMTAKINQNRALSGKTESLFFHGIEELSFDAYFSQATYRKLIAWWSWARQGKAWSFTMDSANIANTTLDGSAASGQKTIPLTATTALSEGDECLIKAADDDEYEIVIIGSVSSGVSVTAVSNLNFTYASGDIFKHFEYYPSMISTDTEFNPAKNGGYYTWTFRFVENL